MMTENMKIWLRALYLEAADQHYGAASNEHLFALGAPNDEASMLHEMNADEHRAFAMMLDDMAHKIYKEEN